MSPRRAPEDEIPETPWDTRLFARGPAALIGPSETDTRPLPPRRDEVMRKLEDLIAGRISRHDAAAWAARWDNAFESGDCVVRDAMTCISAADMISLRRPWLFELEDFELWLEAVKQVATV